MFMLIAILVKDKLLFISSGDCIYVYDLTKIMQPRLLQKLDIVSSLQYYYHGMVGIMQSVTNIEIILFGGNDCRYCSFNDSFNSVSFEFECNNFDLDIINEKNFERYVSVKWQHIDMKSKIRKLQQFGYVTVQNGTDTLIITVGNIYNYYGGGSVVVNCSNAFEKTLISVINVQSKEIKSAVFVCYIVYLLLL